MTCSGRDSSPLDTMQEYRSIAGSGRMTGLRGSWMRFRDDVATNHRRPKRRGNPTYPASNLTFSGVEALKATYLESQFFLGSWTSYFSNRVKELLHHSRQTVFRQDGRQRFYLVDDEATKNPPSFRYVKLDSNESSHVNNEQRSSACRSRYACNNSV